MKKAENESEHDKLRRMITAVNQPERCDPNAAGNKAHACQQPCPKRGLDGRRWTKPQAERRRSNEGKDEADAEDFGWMPRLLLTTIFGIPHAAEQGGEYHKPPSRKLDRAARNTARIFTLVLRVSMQRLSSKHEIQRFNIDDDIRCRECKETDVLGSERMKRCAGTEVKGSDGHWIVS